jgi:hypothetical protein
MGTSSTVCLNCGTQFKGKFCNNCGQKIIEPHERTIKHFVYQFFGSAFFLENNFLKNIWALLSHPGKLPLDFIEGRRKRWMPPFSLFFLLNIFFVWYSPSTDLNLSLREQLFQPHHGWIAKYLVAKKTSAEGISVEEYGELYGQKSTAYSNTLVILHVPILAAFLAFYFKRSKYFYTDHFIYALYFFGFLLLFSLLQTIAIYIFGVGMRMNIRIVWKVLNIIFLIAILIYLFLSLKKTYHQPILSAALSVVPIFVALYITHMLYRTILFLIIYTVT